MTFRHEYKSGHVQFGSLFRDIAAYLPNGERDSVFGWGFNLAGAQKVYKKDTFTYQAAYGPGIQRYLNDTSGLGIDAAVVSNYEKYLRALPTTATYFGYPALVVGKGALERRLWFRAGQQHGIPARLDIPQERLHGRQPDLERIRIPARRQRVSVRLGEE